MVIIFNQICHDKCLKLNERVFLIYVRSLLLYLVLVWKMYLTFGEMYRDVLGAKKESLRVDINLSRVDTFWVPLVWAVYIDGLHWFGLVTLVGLHSRVSLLDGLYPFISSDGANKSDDFKVRQKCEWNILFNTFINTIKVRNQSGRFSAY